VVLPGVPGMGALLHPIGAFPRPARLARGVQTAPTSRFRVRPRIASQPRARSFPHAYAALALIACGADLCDACELAGAGDGRSPLSHSRAKKSYGFRPGRSRDTATAGARDGATTYCFRRELAP